MSISCPRFIECTEVRAVGTRIRKHWDLPSGQGGALAVLGLCFLLGGLAGCLFAALAENQGAVELGSYLEGYLLLARDGGLSVPLWSLLWTRLRDLLAVLILGLTALGVAGIPLLVGVRGFFLCFSAGCFCRVFGGAGLLPAFALFALPALLWAPGLFLAGGPGLCRAKGLLDRAVAPGGRGGGLPPGGQLRRAGLCAGLMLGCALLEYWVVPVLLEACAQAVL